jgi:hypothetical protein
LLEIFDCYQKSNDPGVRFRALRESVWDWHILVHVCQRWRQVVFASPLRLNLRILCTHGTPVQEHLDIWPAFPLNIEYNFSRSIGGIDEDNIICALHHPDRVGAVSLSLTGPQLANIAMVMQEPFPAMTHLFLETHISNDVPVLPCEFLGRSAPSLQRIGLVGIPFPALPSLLLSTSDLVTLYLHNIPQTGYISPEAMVAALATLTRLKDLRFRFQSPASRPDLIRLPPATRTTLSSLTSLEFHGVREYLEDFIAQVDAPLLNWISIYCFNQLVDFEIPQLCQFVDHSEDINRPIRCLVEFQHDNVSFGAGPIIDIPKSEYFEVFPCNIHINILCEGIDWQASHMAQALNQIAAILFNMLHLAIDSDGVSPEPEDLDGIEWLELLRPFSYVQTLFVTGEFFRADFPCTRQHPRDDGDRVFTGP